MKEKPIRIEADVAYIPLTKGYEAVIDSSDVGLAQGHSWYAAKCRDSVYAATTLYPGEGKKERLYLHSLILDPPENFRVSHINSDGLNNRRQNLRVASREEIAQGRRIRKASQSGFKSVTWDKAVKKWRAKIGVKGKTINLGSFDSPEAAHEAYKIASAKYHGDFGRSE